jgi:F0F1-type ATP synthase alpha subunit
LILLFAGRNGYLDKLTIAQVDDFKEFIADWFKDEDAVLAIQNVLDTEDEITRDLTLDSFVKEVVEIIKV